MIYFRIRDSQRFSYEAKIDFWESMAKHYNGISIKLDRYTIGFNPPSIGYLMRLKYSHDVNFNHIWEAVDSEVKTYEKDEELLQTFQKLITP